MADQIPTTYAVGDRVVFRPSFQAQDRRIRGRVGTVVKDGKDDPGPDGPDPRYYHGLYLVDWEGLGEYWELPDHVQPCAAD
jgi:hypothetical protein